VNREDAAFKHELREQELLIEARAEGCDRPLRRPPHRRYVPGPADDSEMAREARAEGR
jgi:hypothetical protein